MWINNQNEDSWFHTRRTSRESKTVFHATQDWWFSQRLLYKTNRKISLPPQLLQILGKHHVADDRHKAFDSTPGDINTRSDYVEQFIFDPDSQIQNINWSNARRNYIPFVGVVHYTITFPTILVGGKHLAFMSHVTKWSKKIQTETNSWFKGGNAWQKVEVGLLPWLGVCGLRENIFWVWIMSHWILSVSSYMAELYFLFSLTMLTVKNNCIGGWCVTPCLLAVK